MINPRQIKGYKPGFQVLHGQVKKNGYIKSTRDSVLVWRGLTILEAGHFTGTYFNFPLQSYNCPNKGKICPFIM